MTHAFTWDDTEWMRDDMILEADRFEEMTYLTKQIDELERRELRRAVDLYKNTVKMYNVATTKPTPPWVMRAIEKLLLKCEQQITALGGEVPYDL